MNRTPRILFVIGLFATAVLVPLVCLAQAATQTRNQPVAAATKGTPTVHATMDRGERAFNANCFRCHQAPESLNPRITGTVVRHMRVRANLSAQDERDILRFLNP
jgi:cytochrome c5